MITEEVRAVDVRVDNHGSLILFVPLTQSAIDWIEDNVPDATRWGNSLVVEPRYAANVGHGMLDDGLYLR
jgi:hypothetical protein